MEIPYGFSISIRLIDRKSVAGLLASGLLITQLPSCWVVVARAGCGSGWLCGPDCEYSWLNMTSATIVASAVMYQLRL